MEEPFLPGAGLDPQIDLEVNRTVAGQLDELARLLEEQGANPFRVRAYRRAAETLRHLGRSVADILADEGVDGPEALPTIGEQLARQIRLVVKTGRLPMLERLRGEADPVALLATVPGVGPVLAERHYTALFSNTAQAHRLGRTHDWVVIYWDGDDGRDGQCTVVTDRGRGPLQGLRVVRGREPECLELARRSG